LRKELDELSVQVVLSHVPKELPDNIIVAPDPTTSGRKFLVLVGLMISAFRVVIALGNRSGLAPSLPLLGAMIIVFGSVIMAAGRA
jgi:hypothetical protein